MANERMGIDIRKNIFDLPKDPEAARVIVMPVPWEATVSYREGTMQAPYAIAEASLQLDYSLPGIEKPWTVGVDWHPCFEHWLQRSKALRPRVRAYTAQLEQGRQVGHMQDLVQEVDGQSRLLRKALSEEVRRIARAGKVPGCVGGEHSLSLGAIEGLSAHCKAQDKALGVLQLDAHMDLRESYQGFRYSHASVMHQVLSQTAVCVLVQVGVRDYAPVEAAFAKQKGVKTFFQSELRSAQFKGASWDEQVREILSFLPAQVYVSFDIDALDIAYCGATGTPVPGGLSFDEAMYLLEALWRSGRRIVGFDLNEVVPQGVDADVAARILYRLCVYAGLHAPRHMQGISD